MAAHVFSTSNTADVAVTRRGLTRTELPLPRCHDGIPPAEHVQWSLLLSIEQTKAQGLGIIYFL